MSTQKPCLIFDENCNLCDEIDVLASVREAYDLLSLRHDLFASLVKNLRAFQEFCEINSEESAGEYRIFKLKRRFGNYLYLYCEKNIISGNKVNIFIVLNISLLVFRSGLRYDKANLLLGVAYLT